MKYYLGALRGLLFLIPFLSLWISSSLFFPYITGRNFAFRILIELALALWLGLMIVYKEYRPKFTPMVAALTVFLFVVGLANLLGVDPYHSFWSSFERMEGYLMFLHLVPYFFMLTTVFSKKDWQIFFHLFLITGVLVGGYGVLQKLGLREAIQGGERIDGTIGNPTYLAAYLALVLVITALLFIKAKDRWLKLLYAAAGFFFLLMIYYTASRGAALGLFTALVVFTALYLLFVKSASAAERKFKKILIGGVIAAAALFGLIWLLRHTEFVRNNYVLERLSSISLESKTIRSRFLIWNMSWQAFKERPILGWGQENYLRVFAKYYDPRLYDQEPWFDRAHNIIFDWLINAGILGLLAYLGLFGALFYTLYRGWQQNALNVKEAIIIFSGMVLYFVQNLFVFDNFNTYIIFFAILAYVNSSVYGRPQSTFLPAKSNLWLVVLPAAVAMFLAVYHLNARPLAQAKGIIDSLRATIEREDPVGKALKSFQKTLAYQSMGEAETLEHFLRTANRLALQERIPKEQKIEFLTEAAAAAEQYLQKAPKDIRMHFFLSSLYNRMLPFGGEYLIKAREHIQAAMALSPKRQDIYSLLAENYLIANDIKKAIEVMEEAIKIYDRNSEIYGNLGRLAALDGQDELVDKVVDELVRIFKETDRPSEPGAASAVFAENMNKIGVSYIQLNQLSRARDIYEEIIKYRPETPQYHVALTNIYLQLGQRDKAIASAKKVAELDPQAYGNLVEELLEQLE